MLDFTGKTVLITGANGAIGRVASELFHRHHANVVLTDLDRDAIEQFAVEAKLHDARLLALQQDARSAEHAEAAVKAAVERFGGLNYLITAAGYLRRQAVLELTDEQMSEMLAVNFLGVFATCRAAARVMQPGSAIVNLTSLAAHTGRKHGSHYAAAKGAVLAFTKSLAVELARESASMRFHRVSSTLPCRDLSSASKATHSCNKSRCIASAPRSRSRTCSSSCARIGPPMSRARPCTSTAGFTSRVSGGRSHPGATNRSTVFAAVSIRSGGRRMAA